MLYIKIKNFYYTINIPISMEIFYEFTDRQLPISIYLKEPPHPEDPG